MTTIGSTGRIATFLAAAILLIGLGYTAILPPFEGFDEYAYYSSIRQIADTGTLPLFGKSFIDQKIVRYLETAPTSWGTLHPPFEQADRKTYAAFFKDAKAVDYYRRHWSRAADWSFAASAMQNWESQHPPLYYLLVAPLMKASEGLTLPTQVLVLRIFSYLLAFLGLMIGWRATALVFQRTDLTAGYLFYPFIFPMFFGEFARIGNNSLCLLLFAVIYSLTLRNIGQSLDRATALATGVCFGLGLLTKAFFIPALAGYAGFLALRGWSVRSNPKELQRHLFSLVLVVLPAILIGGGWYLYDYVKYGSPTGSFESISLDQAGGLIANLTARFSFSSLARELIVTVATWSWAGSWSLVRMSPILQAPLPLLAAWIAVAYVRNARQYSPTDVLWLPVWLFVPLVLGLVYHAFVSIALDTSGTPGWYLNMLAPFLALATTYGITTIARKPVERFFLQVSIAYTAAFLSMAIWSQAAMFAGCAIKGDDKYYHFADERFCLTRIEWIAGNISLFGWPHPALLAIVVGLFCFVMGLAGFSRPQMGNPVAAGVG